MSKLSETKSSFCKMDPMPQEINSIPDNTPEWASPGRRRKHKHRKKKKKTFSKSKFKKNLKKFLNIMLWVILFGCFIGSLLVIILNVDLAEGVKKKKRTTSLKTYSIEMPEKGDKRYHPAFTVLY